MADLDRGPILALGEEIAAGYQVVAHLRRGKRLDVYDVWSTERGCRCVAKAIAPDRVHESRACDKLIEEGRQLLSLTHPYLVRAYELTVATSTGAPVLIMETLSGRTLSHLIDEFDEGLDVIDVAWLGLQLCSVIGYLHDRGIRHLDVKPDNVICEAGRARIIGLSIAGQDGPATRGAGTYDYLAPEQARGDEVSAATDVWGVGITLYEALTGTVPFEPDERPGASWSSGGSAVSSETDASGDFDGDDYPQATERAPSVGSRRKGLPPALIATIDACLDPSADGRPTLAALADALAEVADSDLRAPAEST